MSWRRRSGSRRRQRRRSSRIRAGTDGGKRLPVRLARENGDHDVGDGLAFERLPARKQLVQEAPESPDVGAAIDGFPARLLRRHVRGRAEDHALPRAARRHGRRVRDVAAPSFSAPKAFASPKSSTLTLPARRDLDVGRLQVPMHDPLLVRRSERLGDLPAERQRLVHGHGPGNETLGKRLAGNELEHEEADAARFLEPVDRGDVRMIQGGEDLRLAFEARQALGVARERLRKRLDGDLAVEPRIARLVDLSHSSRAQRRKDLVRTEFGSGWKRHDRPRREESPEVTEGGASRRGCERAATGSGARSRLVRRAGRRSRERDPGASERDGS